MVIEDALGSLLILGQPKVRLPRWGPSRKGVRWILVRLLRRDWSERSTIMVWLVGATVLQGAPLRAARSVLGIWRGTFSMLMRFCQKKCSLRIMWQRLIPCRLDRVKLNGQNQNSWKISTTLCQCHLYFLKKWSISPCSCVRGWAHAYALTNPIFKFWLALFLSHSLSEIIFVFFPNKHVFHVWYVD